MSDFKTAFPSDAFHWLCVTRLGQEARGAAEVAHTLSLPIASSTIQTLLPGVLHISWPRSQPLPASPVTLAFVRQSLPDAIFVETLSVQKGAAALAQCMIEACRTHLGPVRLHVWSHPEWRLASPPLPSVTSGRCKLIREGCLEILRRKQKRLLAQLTDDTRPLADDEALIQLFLLTPESAVVSCLLPDAVRHFRRALSSFPEGYVQVPQDPAPPSRAYRKLLEAELLLGTAIQPHQTCVDLGASPGGFTAIALNRGAHVTAVDRSALREDLMQHRALTFIRGDGFTFKPAQRVDWLLCDIIAFPEKSITLLEQWLEAALCRYFVVTIKFRGAEDDACLERLKQSLTRHCEHFLLRQLTNNHNEVTALGRAKSQ